MNHSNERYEFPIAEPSAAAASTSYEDAMLQLLHWAIDRIPEKRITWRTPTYVFPLMIFFIRGDRGGQGRVLADEARSSFRYWDLDSKRDIDLLLPGWEMVEGTLVFDTPSFLEFRGEIEHRSRWRYSGQAEILLLNYEFEPWAYSLDFRFEETITLPVEQMLTSNLTPSLDALMHEVISVAKGVKDGSVWEISDRIARQRVRESIWQFLKKRFSKSLSKVYDELRPFAVCDLRPSSERK